MRVDGEQAYPDDPDTQLLNTKLKVQQEESKNLYLTEAIAYYNLGASYEHLGGAKLDEAIKSYEIAAQIAQLHLPQGHPLG